MLSLLSTFLFASSALALPSMPRAYPVPTPATTCTQRSTNITRWTVESFDYHASYVFSTPAHQIAGGYVNFTLVNPAVDETVICSASSSQLEDFFYGNQVFNCIMPTGSNDQATFTYSRPSGELQINETWYCPGEGSHFSAIGGVTLNLTCEDTTWQNSNWTSGELYSDRTVTCGKVTVPASIEEMSAVM